MIVRVRNGLMNMDMGIDNERCYGRECWDRISSVG